MVVNKKRNEYRREQYLSVMKYVWILINFDFNVVFNIDYFLCNYRMIRDSHCLENLHETCTLYMQYNTWELPEDYSG